MPRPEPSRDEIEQRLLALVMRDGLAHVSIADLTEAAGTNRAFIYKHWGSREDLLAHLVERYTRRVDRHMLSAVRQHGGIAGLLAYLDRLEHYLAGPEGRRGCLAVHSAVTAPHAPQVAQALRAHALMFLETFLAAFGQQQERTGLAAGANPQQCAQLMVAMVQGALVTARTFPKDTLARDAVHAIRAWLVQQQPRAA